MNHQPFEDWLLADERLTPQQERELQGHLRGCGACSGIAASNLALHSRRMVAPAPGFSGRFRPRLAAWQRTQVRRQAIGTIILVVIGVGLLYALAGPSMLEAIRSPAAWLGQLTAMLIELLTLVSVVAKVGNILLRHMPSAIPAGAGLAIAVGCGILAGSWIFMMRRLARSPQGV